MPALYAIKFKLQQKNTSVHKDTRTGADVLNQPKFHT